MEIESPKKKKKSIVKSKNVKKKETQVEDKATEHAQEDAAVQVEDKATEHAQEDAESDVAKPSCSTEAPSLNCETSGSFAELGVNEALCETIQRLGWLAPTPIQRAALPPALSGRDVIGLAETGSGKTAAFSIPVIQALMEKPRAFFALIVTPTRELALQIKEQVRALGAGIGVRCACLVGGATYRDQALQLGQAQPHVVIGTPGRLVDHLERTQGFDLQLRRMRFLVLDEADRLLNADFELQLSKLLASLPKQRATFLFSATMTRKVAKLQRASLRDPARVEVSKKSRPVAGLQQFYVLVPQVKRDCALLLLLRSRFADSSCILFVDTCEDSMRLALTLSYAGLPAIPLNGRMTQNRRLAALNKFRAEGGCLVATDVASRGLDLPLVDAVLLYNAPTNIKDYVHRVGRTARAGRSGQAVTLVTQYDVVNFQLIERALERQLPALELDDGELKGLLEEVREADQVVRKVLSEKNSGKRKAEPEDPAERKKRKKKVT